MLHYTRWWTTTTWTDTIKWYIISMAVWYCCVVQSAGASLHVSHHINSGWATAVTSSVYNRLLLPRLNDSASVCDINITCNDRTCQFKPTVSSANNIVYLTHCPITLQQMSAPQFEKMAHKITEMQSDMRLSWGSLWGLGRGGEW